MTVDTHKETLGFQAEVRQLLDLMIHSLYSNREIFLRELVSNASDAADKLRFEALSDDALYEGDSELKIRVSFDKAARTVTISDNGIGMNRAEVIENDLSLRVRGRSGDGLIAGTDLMPAFAGNQQGVERIISRIPALHALVPSRRARPPDAGTLFHDARFGLWFRLHDDAGNHGRL